MNCKHFYKLFFLSKGMAVNGFGSFEPLKEPDLLVQLSACENAGADGAIIIDLADDDKEREININFLKKIKRALNIPIIAGGNINRFEDSKKILYAGCEKVLINVDDEDRFKALKETKQRFGKERIVGYTSNVHLASGKYDMIFGHEADDLVSSFLFETKDSVIPPATLLKDAVIPVIPILMDEDIDETLLNNDALIGYTGPAVDALGNDIYEYKLKVRDQLHVNVDIFESAIPWSDLKKGPNGLVPVIIQDHKTDEVLMQAYMNEESFNLTLKSGKMTYWSRSRESLWTKGESSGNFQYVKSMSIDCDNDSILAKVIQIGAACHTGNKSCFYREMFNDNIISTNPYKVFEDVYAVIADRKVNPKEGSYTNYLFEKGIDKILKKVGEEATEIVIAAKNPDAEEIKYEVADFLYHVMVLMVERGVTWTDITEELSKR